MKNKASIKKFIGIELLLFLVIILLSIVVSVSLANLYEKRQEENNSYIFNRLLEDNPELEEKIVRLILESEYGKNDYDSSLLEKNGITKEDLNFSSDSEALRTQVVRCNVLFVIVSFSLLTTTFIIYIIKENRKIKNISNYLNQTLNGNYSMDIRDFDEGAISHLKNDIYKVTVKLKEQHDLLIEDKKRLEDTLSDISHQLKTPLTSMYVINDLLDKDLDKDVKKEMLSRNFSQLQRIEWLVTSLLKISRLDSGTVILKNDKVKALDLIHKALEPLRIPLELKNITLVVDCPKNITLFVDLNWTTEALVNIIKNACEHTKENGKIEIAVIENPIYVEIMLKDNGCGIKEKDINHIFERFYKGEGNPESIGIGLNMAKKIIDLENGEIRVKSKENLGTTFFIKFYKNVV